MPVAVQSLQGHVAIVFGTRPEIIKLGPVAQALDGRAKVVWSGQHFDPALRDAFFRTHQMPSPVLEIPGVGGAPRGGQITAMLSALSWHFSQDPPSAVVVQGDTNTANAAAQAGHYAGIPVVHVEAGLRSFDHTMPEEVNRTVVGAVADLHCCPTAQNADNLRRAGVDGAAIRVTGNPLVEAVSVALPALPVRRRIVAAHGLGEGDFVLATLHRTENTDDPVRLRTALDRLATLPWPVVLPLHPRTAAAVDRFGLGAELGQLSAIAPVDHPTLLSLAAAARVVVSDSGGLQEEVTVLKRPVVVVRTSTERPEAVELGFSVLAEPADLVDAVRRMARPEVVSRLATLPCPFGDGHAGERIATEILQMTAGQPGRLARAG